MILYGKKTVLLPMAPQEWPYFFEVYGHEGNRKLYDLGKLGDEKAIQEALEAMQDDGRAHFWIAKSKQGKAAERVGVLFVLDGGDHRCSVNGAVDRKFLKGLGKRLRDTDYREEYGETYTEDAFKTVIDFCFDRLKKERLESNVEEENKLAVNLNKKVGFRKEGVLRHFSLNGKGYLNVVVMSILREEWNNGDHSTKSRT